MVYLQKKIVFKLFSKLSNFLVDFNLSFIGSLNASYLEMDGESSVDWIPSKISFPSLTLPAIRFCSERKHFHSLFPKSSQQANLTYSWGFSLWEDQGFSFLWGFRGAPLLCPNFKNQLFCWMSPATFCPCAIKSSLPLYSPFPPLIVDHILEKNSIYNSFRQILPYILPVACIFSRTIIPYLKEIIGIKSLNTKQCSVG